MPRIFRALPATLNQAVLKLPTKQQPGAMDMLLYLLGKYHVSGVDPGDWLEVSREHLFNQVEKNYYRHRNTLEKAGIIEIDHRYTPPRTDDAGQLKQGQCKKYRIPARYVESDPEIIEVLTKNAGDFDNTPPIRSTVALLSRLAVTLSPRALRAHIADLIDEKYIRAKVRVGTEIARDTYTSEGKTYPLSTWLKIADSRGKECILYRDRFYIDDVDQFTRRHVYFVRCAYLDAILRLKRIEVRANIFCSRNTTNNRLDTNLTTLPSMLLNLLRLDGEHLTSIDLKNSQFNLLHTVLYYTALYIKHLQGNPDNAIFENGPQMLKSKNVDKRVRKQGISRIEKKDCTINVHHLEKKNACNELSANNLEGEIFWDNNVITCPISGLPMDKISRLTDWLKRENYLDSLILAFQPFLGATCDFEALFSELHEKRTIAACGGYYEAMRQNLQSASGQTYTRDETKKIAFVVAFSSWRYNRAHKLAFRQFAPLTCRLMDAFKRAMIERYELEQHPDARDAGNASLAVMLQKLESEIFIDNALKTLLNAGYRCFSKHDSILCKKSDTEPVKAILAQSLDTWLSGYSLDVKHLAE